MGRYQITIQGSVESALDHADLVQVVLAEVNALIEPFDGLIEAVITRDVDSKTTSQVTYERETDQALVAEIPVDEGSTGASTGPHRRLQHAEEAPTGAGDLEA